MAQCRAGGFFSFVQNMDVGRIGCSAKIETPAKLNLFLEVLGKRDDGFHEIETLVTAVTIYDTLYFTSNSEGQIRLTCKWASGMEAKDVSCGSKASTPTLGDLPEGTENIVSSAVERLRRRAGVELGASIRLVKRIPSAAGLGGASSDAAAALVAANEFWRLGWSRQRLAELAAEIGSDVPFFLTSGQSGATVAICRGRGERIEPVSGMTKLHFVVVRPPGGLETAAVYRRCHAAERPVDLQPLIEALREGDVALAGRSLFNRLQATAQELSPWIGKARSLFARLDCLGHQMSGSGTSYFGICRNARHARRLSTRLRTSGFGHVFHGVTASAAHRLEAIPA